MSSPGRNNNCVDCTRAVESTWRGNPEMAAAMDNPNADGTDAGRITEWAGGTFQKATYDEIRAKLESLGDRSSAMIVSAWAGGRGGHAFNAINDGNVKFVDGQSGTVSGWPPVSWSENQTSGSWAVYFDSNGNPV
nr:toxin glutamine deamidase domain-containing protein [Glycomyces buryatensis]